ncbi:MAG: class I SAM-dependent methyltransferase [Planctomycetes bacterium]|nr:class I SAM-dependent methyltransferase [Planctomycetota bacterium]
MRQAEACPFTLRRLETIRSTLGDPALTAATIQTLETLAPDPNNKPRLIEWLQAGVESKDRRYEIRSALRALSHAIRPRSYLEIGTRRGWSLAQVLCESSAARAYSFDRWVEGYGGVENPGPEFVREEMRRAAPEHSGGLRFIPGNSHDTLPVFFQGVPLEVQEFEDLSIVRAGEDAPRSFDLVTVDGDHTALGTWWDVTDVLPFVAIGGAIVIDDLVDTADEALGDRATSRYAAIRPSPEGLESSLLDVWNRLKAGLDNYEFIESFDSIVPIGIAIRMH